MKKFYFVLANSLAAFLVNTFVWFAVTFWVYLETRSVIATAVMAGIYTSTVALSGLFLGSLVDHYPKKTVMMLSSICSLVLYILACAVFVTTPREVFTNASSVYLWAFIVLALFGALAGNLRGIALSTLVTIMVAEEVRDKANGLVGTSNGIGFLGASIFSGLVIGYLGVAWMLLLAIGFTLLIIAHLATLTIPDFVKKESSETEEKRGRVDVRGTIRAVKSVPGLFGLIFFQCFNNFLGGIFMALMDAYGLLLVSVQVWGTLWGCLSLAFIIGGLIVARKGLGRNPLRTMFLADMAMWSACSVFTVQPSIVLLTIGIFVWISLAPVIEAAEHTILQKVVSPERQGRVFGFAQSVEQSASPITAFLIGPVAQLVFIPFMTTGAGVDHLGWWFGTGPDRGLALLFTVAGLIGLMVTVLAMRSNAYRLLARNYEDPTDLETQPKEIVMDAD